MQIYMYAAYETKMLYLHIYSLWAHWRGPFHGNFFAKIKLSLNFAENLSWSQQCMLNIGNIMKKIHLKNYGPWGRGTGPKHGIKNKK